MGRKPALHPCPDCGVRLMRHKSGPHGLAWHGCVAINPDVRLQVHQQVVEALTSTALSPDRAQTVMVKLLVMRCWEDGASAREIGEALKQLGAGPSGGGGKGKTPDGAMLEFMS